MEQGQMIKTGKYRYLMYMKGLKSDEFCLQCHSEKGAAHLTLCQAKENGKNRYEIFG